MKQSHLWQGPSKFAKYSHLNEQLYFDGVSPHSRLFPQTSAQKNFLYVPYKKEKKPEGEQSQDVRVDRKNNARLCLQYMDSIEYQDDMDHLENVLDGYRRMNAFDRVNYGLGPSHKKKRSKSKKVKDEKVQKKIENLNINDKMAKH